MKLRSFGLKSAAVLAAFAALVGCGGDGEQSAEETPGPVSDPYPYDPVNLDLWLERLEVGSRELYSARANVAEAVVLAPGARVADVGAGTGLYTLLFAERVGPDGVAYAVDIAPRFLTLINQRAEDNGHENIVSVLGRVDSVTLPAGSVDVVFIADTYHYFDDPAAIMKTVHEALRPGGVLYVVDFDLADGETAPPEQRHVRFGEAGVKAEIESFGFGAGEKITVEGLEENYMLRFTRP